MVRGSETRWGVRGRGDRALVCLAEGEEVRAGLPHPRPLSLDEGEGDGAKFGDKMGREQGERRSPLHDDLRSSRAHLDAPLRPAAPTAVGSEL